MAKSTSAETEIMSEYINTYDAYFILIGLTSRISDCLYIIVNR